MGDRLLVSYLENGIVKSYGIKSRRIVGNTLSPQLIASGKG